MIPRHISGEKTFPEIRDWIPDIIPIIYISIQEDNSIKWSKEPKLGYSDIIDYRGKLFRHLDEYDNLHMLTCVYNGAHQFTCLKSGLRSVSLIEKDPEILEYFQYYPLILDMNKLLECQIVLKEERKEQ